MVLVVRVVVGGLDLGVVSGKATFASVVLDDSVSSIMEMDFPILAFTSQVTGLLIDWM